VINFILRVGVPASMDTVSPSQMGSIRFGVYEVDFRAGELRKQGVKIKLQDQPFHVLLILLEKPGEIVTREELRKRIWPSDTFVDFDGGVNNAVKRLREALSDRAETPRYIETLPRRGYRFIAPINGSAPSTPSTTVDGHATPHCDADSQPARQSLRPDILIGVGCATLLLVILMFTSNKWRHGLWDKSAVTQIESIAVLPLDNLSHDLQQDYLSDGMTDELINELGQIKTLRVVSRTSVMQFKGSHRPLSEIATILKVDAVVEGAVLRSGGQVRITAELVDAKSDKQLWAHTFEGKADDLLALQSHVANAVAQQVHVTISPDEYARIANVRPVKPEAHDAYLKGVFFWRTSRNPEDWKKALAFFELAVQKDPTYAQAYAGLAGVYDSLTDVSVPAMVARIKVREAAEKALELDDSLAEAHLAMGAAHDADWNWPAADIELKRAIELNPSSAWAHFWYGSDLIDLGHADAGVAEIRKAVDLDPLSTSLRTTLAWRLYFVRQYDESLAEARHVLEVDPKSSFAHAVCGSDYEQQGKYDEAMAEWRASLTLDGDSQLAARITEAYEQSGYGGALQVWLKALLEKSRHEYMSPLRIAELYAFLGQKDEAFIWLEKAFQEHTGDLMKLNSYPMWDSLRSDGRFKDLVRRVGLPS
jgi:TolB-like protein/DNA-binding winged helix-turn-helix (wHTH) protein/tetratricopeptide (TPR) repeat protein